MEEDVAQAELYHVNGTYPATTYFYHQEADQSLNPVDGWCDYSAPSCTGRSHGDPINITDSLKVILAYAREGQSIDPGILNQDNKLDGEGPFRVVPPQKGPNPPDQSSNAANQTVVWPYEHDWDHNAGAATRSVTIIRVEPLPAGMTDINILEAGWSYIDNAKIIVYGAIDGTDSNSNGVLDSEEGSDPGQDADNDGIPDYQDTDTARVRHAGGSEKILMQTTAGAFSEVKCLGDDDPEVPQTGKPNMRFPYGTLDFSITGLAAGQSVDLALTFPEDVPIDYKYYKISAANGWVQTPFASNDGDNVIVLTLTDGDPATDADGVANGVIQDPGALASSSSSGSGGGGGGGCFISSTSQQSPSGIIVLVLSVGCGLIAAVRFSLKFTV